MSNPGRRKGGKGGPPGRRRGGPGAAGGGSEWLYGINPVEAALREGRRSLSALALREGRPSPRLQALAALAGERGLPLEMLSPRDLEARCGSPSHQGVLLRCGPLPAGGHPPPPEAGTAPCYVALDQVEDPRNLGAVVRSAAAFGAAGLVLPRDRAAPFSPAASSASAGALESFPLYVVPNLARYLAEAGERGFWTIGAVSPQAPETDGADSAHPAREVLPLHRLRLQGPKVLVLGSEGRGLRPLVRRHCEVLVTIPLPGLGGETAGAREGLDSLNVSAAAAVLLYGLNQSGD